MALNDNDIATLARHNTHVAHCPTANLKLGSGIARSLDLNMAGINIGVGTDGAAGNNRLDLLSEARLAGLLAKGTSGEANALPAHELIYMATLGGAHAIGLGERIGSLVPGKQADLCALRLDTPATVPVFDAASHVLYAAGREHVSDVWIDGESVVKRKQLVRISQEEVYAKAKTWQNRLRG